MNKLVLLSTYKMHTNKDHLKTSDNCGGRGLWLFLHHHRFNICFSAQGWPAWVRWLPHFGGYWSRTFLQPDALAEPNPLLVTRSQRRLTFLIFQLQYNNR